MKTATLEEIKNNFNHFYQTAHIEVVRIEDADEVDVVMIPAVVFEQMRKEFRPDRDARLGNTLMKILKEVSEKNYSEMDNWDDEESSGEILAVSVRALDLGRAASASFASSGFG